MASFRSSPSPALHPPSESYTEMHNGDVDAIGEHCQFCRQLDLLPFKCESCRGTFCKDHRTESSHSCPKPGAWLKARAEHDQTINNASGRTLLSVTPKKKCAHPNCKTDLDMIREGVHCDTCNRDYCGKHRLLEVHNCKNLVPIGARPQPFAQQREKAQTAITRFQKWAAEKRKQEEERRKARTSFFKSAFQSKEQIERAEETKRINEIKRKAKGDLKIPQEKRIYFDVEASADTTKAKYPTGQFYYNKEWSVGRFLDVAAKSLQVQNVNNRGDNEEDILRVFNVRIGRIMPFAEKLGDRCITGDMLVLLRGVGEPDLIDLN